MSGYSVPCGEVVTSNGQALGVCVAESEAAARAAVRVIRVTYGPDLPSIMSIDAAIAVGSFFSHPRLTDHVLERGDAVSAIAAAGADPSLLVLSGEGRCGGQEHFYLEPHGALLLPTEGGGMDMVSSTQGPTDNQHAVAHVLGLPYNLVHCAVRRLGGGFGGKESKAAGVAAVAAVPATSCAALRRRARPRRRHGYDGWAPPIFWSLYSCGRAGNGSLARHRPQSLLEWWSFDGS